MNKWNLGAFVGILLVSFVLLKGSKSVDTAFEKASEALYLPQVVKAPRIKKDLSFAGETIPVNEETRERIDREFITNSYFHTSTVWALKMHTRFFPMMERILSEQGLSDDFKYLAVAESNLMNATSPAGAKGIWQFMPGTARELGLEVSPDVDERYHVEKATQAACRYLKRLNSTDGSWINAAAAYNVGPGRLKSQMNLQGETSFFDMSLNEETSRYVFRLVAIKEIMKDPTNFGFYLEPDDYYQPIVASKTIKVTSSIASWAAFAHQNKCTYKMFKYYNPWLISDKLTISSANNGGRTSYEVLIP